MSGPLSGERKINSMKVLIAYDGSPCAQAALDDLPRTGLPADVHALVLSVADVWLPPTLPSDGPTPPGVVGGRIRAARQKMRAQAMRKVESAQALARQAGERLRTTFPDWQVETEGEGDSPAWTIIKKAKSWKPHLVIVGAHGRPLLDRLILGSVSQKVVAETRCAVRIARKRVTDNTAPVRLMIGMDYSPSAKAALHAITQRVWPAGSTARVISVLDPVLLATAAWETLQSEDNGAGHTLIQQRARAAADQLSSAGLTASSVVVEGHPKEVLIKEAENWGADCIFVGTSGLRGLDRFLLGSVSTAITTSAPCSVEVVREVQAS